MSDMVSLGDILGEEASKVAELTSDPEVATVVGLLRHPDMLDGAIRAGLSTACFLKPTCRALIASVLRVHGAARVPTRVELDADLRASEGVIRASTILQASESWFWLRIERPAAERALGVVLSEHRREELKRTLSILLEAANHQTPGELVAEAKALLDRLEPFQSSGANLTEVVSEVLRQAELGPANGIDPGYRDWSRMVGGLRGGDLHIIGARTSIGKSAFAHGIIDHVCVTEQIPVALWSWEMPAKQCIARLISRRASVDVTSLRDGKVRSREEWSKVNHAAGVIAEAPLEIFDRGGMSSRELCSEARGLVASGVRLLVVDQLTNVRLSASKDRFDIRLKEVTGELKSLAVERDVPVILLHQINRGVEGRADKRPNVADFRDGSVEDDADVVTGLYRAEYYMRDDTPESLRGRGEAIVLKNRDGATGAVDMSFTGRFARWGDLDGTHHGVYG